LADSARYGDRVTIPEPYSIEHIPFAERHGHSRQLLWLWLAANLTIADFALGFLPVKLGLSVAATLLALALGNVLGGFVLAWSAAMGPAAGYPQMFIGRRAFGRVGGYIPAALDWLSPAGWFTVNPILGAFAIQLLLPGLTFWVAAAILVVVQTLLVVYGHNVIQEFERYGPDPRSPLHDRDRDRADARLDDRGLAPQADCQHADAIRHRAGCLVLLHHELVAICLRLLALPAGDHVALVHR